MNGLHLLPDNQDISDVVDGNACLLLDQVRTLHLGSRRYIPNHTIYPDRRIAEHRVAERPNAFIRRPANTGLDA
ncbi:MAG: hypothetical protein ABJA98_09270 [Acidobacteriota bacterium]